VRVLSLGSTSIAAKAIAEDFTKATGHTVTFTIRPPFNIDAELAKSTFDVIVLSVPAMDAHDKAGDIAPNSRLPLARVGVAVGVKPGIPVPDVSTPEKFKAAVLAAKSLAQSDPSAPNTSGAIAGAAFAKLGITEDVKSKTQFGTGPEVGKRVADGGAEMGFLNISEFPAGVQLAGMFPTELQKYTVYEAAVMSKGSKDAAASALVKHLSMSGSMWQTAKLEPWSTYRAPPTQ
jgi:molybdate transport system substrate-binding protein